MEDSTLPEEPRVLLMFEVTNRDERKWDKPERFHVSRNPADHFALGQGVHRRAGKGPISMWVEPAAVSNHPAREVHRFELEGEPERHPNDVVRGLSQLSVGVRKPL